MKKFLLVVMLLMVLVLTACAEVNEVVDEVEENVEEDVSGSVVEFDVVATKWEWTPSTIEVQEGDTVLLNLVSEDVTHGFDLSAFGISENLEPGESVSVEFVADQVGTHSFSCSVYCGSGHGSMVGELVVV